MAKIERFEELLCWKKARQMANEIHCLACHPAFASDYRLRNQIEDAAGSVMHNIAEGFDAGSDAEFIRFLKIARRSASEVQSELYLALDRQYITRNEQRCGYDLATEAKRLINGLIAYLRQHKQERKGISDSTENVYMTIDYPAENYSTDDYQTNDNKTKD